ncbi:acetylcholine receptor subunit beta-like [Ornithodoros turicata]|uniref:acetylcholine receptor subunit beta-like n=1 Tax=Ornithodoros turicata TaxID=34597 RepID=UPI003139A6A6
MDSHWVWCIVHLSLFAHRIVCDDSPNEDTYMVTARLKARLLDPKVYDRVVRPTGINSTVTPIGVDIVPESVAHAGMSTDSLEISFLYCMTWSDPRLQWDRKKDDPTFFIAPTTSVWVPDTTLLNANPNMIYVGQDNVVDVQDNGIVLMCPSLTATVPCTMDMRNFPYDVHECTLQFASLSYSDSEIEYTTKIRPTPTNNVSSEWDVQVVSFQKGKVLNHTSLDLVVRMRRTGGVYPYTVTLPTLALAFVTLAIFWMPPDSDRRITVGLFGLLATYLLLSWMTWTMEAHVFVPRIITFLGSTMLVEAIVIGFSVVTMNLVNTSMPSPDLLVRFLRGPAAKFLCLSQQVKSPGAVDTDDDGQINSKENDSDWYMIAQCLDRFLFLVFLAVFVALEV